MPILNRQKLRPDVLKLMDDIFKLQTRGVFKFLKGDKDLGQKFTKLWQNLMKGNEQFFKKVKTNEELSTMFTYEDMRLLARAFRFAYDFVFEHYQKNNPILENVKIKQIDIHGVPAEWQVSSEIADNKVILYFHGGGYVLGSPTSHRLLTITLGKVTKMRMLSVDYRLGPEYKYPAPLEDALNVYKWLLDSGIKPENIIIAGDSAGGHLTFITLIKLRDEGIPMPAGAIAMSPFADSSQSGASFFKNAETDPILGDIGVFWWGKATSEGIEPTDSRISPVFADLTNLPPMLVQASKSEILYSDSVRIVENAKFAGVNATLQAWDDMPHVFQLVGLNKLPESKEAIDNIAEFVEKIIN